MSFKGLGCHRRTRLNIYRDTNSNILLEVFYEFLLIRCIQNLNSYDIPARININEKSLLGLYCPCNLRLADVNINRISHYVVVNFHTLVVRQIIGGDNYVIVGILEPLLIVYNLYDAILVNFLTNADSTLKSQFCKIGLFNGSFYMVDIDPTFHHSMLKVSGE